MHVIRVYKCKAIIDYQHHFVITSVNNNHLIITYSSLQMLKRLTLYRDFLEIQMYIDELATLLCDILIIPYILC